MKRLVAGTFFISVVGLGAPALADSGGPDAGGYTWADVYEINGPIYDPQGATFGTALTLGDDDSQLVTLPFSFDWYGSTYTSAYINSNGVLSFSAPQEDTTLVLCGSGTPVPIAAPWWIDILPANNGSIRYDTHGATGTRIFVAQWLEVENYPSSTGFATFEVQLHEIDDHVEFHYEDVTFSVTASDYGADGFVGVAGNGITTQISCDTTILGNGYAIGIYPGGGTVCVDLDGDGFEDDACGGTDCNDTNANINPGMNEVCDGVDNDCDFLVDEGFDVDNDGWSTCGGDCNDSSSNVNPGLSESCFDGVDNDCDGWTDSADSECAGDDDDSTSGDDDDSTSGDDDDTTSGDDDDSTAGDDDDSTAGDDDDTTSGDDDDTTSGDDDDTGDDDDSASTGDDDDDTGGGGGRGSSRSACSQAGAAGLGAGWLLLVAGGLLRRRRLH